MSILALRSNNLHDIQAAIQKGGWTNTCKNSRVKAGDLVIVFGNKGVCAKAGVVWEEQMVLVGVLKKEPYVLTTEDKGWPSNQTGTDNQYFVRFDLNAMDLVPFQAFPHVINALKGKQGHLRGGLYLE